MGKHYQKPVKPNEKSELRFNIGYSITDGIAAGDYVLVAQRMNPDR